MVSPNFERGSQLFELGRYKEAIKYLQDALSEDIDGFVTKYYLAQCFFQTDETEKALNLALELRTDDPNADRAYFLLSQIYLHKDDDYKAGINIDKAIELYPYNENYFGQKAYIFLFQKKFEKALEFANEGLKINAQSNYCLNARTTALTKLNRKEEAKSAIEYLLQDNPEDAYSHSNAGWSYLENNNTKKAAIHFKEALMLNPNLEHARNGMATTLKSKNKVYNLYLRYVFWMNKKSEKNQWFFIIGIYFAYRFGVKILSASGLTYLAFPLIILYLLFALGSWIMDPLSNMLLMLDKYGKYLLDKQEKLSGLVMFGLLISSLILFCISLITKVEYFTILSFSCLAAILPLTKAFSSNTINSKYINLAYGSAMILIAIVGSILAYSFSSIGLVIGAMFIAYTWLSGLILK